MSPLAQGHGRHHLAGASPHHGNILSLQSLQEPLASMLPLLEGKELINLFHTSTRGQIGRRVIGRGILAFVKNALFWRSWPKVEVIISTAIPFT